MFVNEDLLTSRRLFDECEVLEVMDIVTKRIDVHKTFFFKSVQNFRLWTFFKDLACFLPASLEHRSEKKWKCESATPRFRAWKTYPFEILRIFKIFLISINEFLEALEWKQVTKSRKIRRLCSKSSQKPAKRKVKKDFFRISTNLRHLSSYFSCFLSGTRGGGAWVKHEKT